MEFSSTRWSKRLWMILLILVAFSLLKLLQEWWQPLLMGVIKLIVPFLLAGVIAYLLHPFIAKLEGFHIPRSLAIGLVYTLFISLLAGGVIGFGPRLLHQIEEMTVKLPAFISAVENQAEEIKEQIEVLPENLHHAIFDWLHEGGNALEEHAVHLVDHWPVMVEGIVFLFLIPFIVFYLLKDVRAFERLAKRFIPSKKEEEGERLIRAVDRALGGYIRGQLIVSACVGGLAILGLWLIGVPHALLFGLVIGLFDLIPYVGPLLGAAPALVGAATQSLSLVAWTGVILFIIQQVESNLLSPYIVGKSVHLHPLIILLALMAGFELGGVVGLIIAVPLAVVIGEIIREFHALERVTSS